jgi:hypothetical protein
VGIGGSHTPAVAAPPALSSLLNRPLVEAVPLASCIVDSMLQQQLDVTMVVDEMTIGVGRQIIF